LLLRQDGDSVVAIGQASHAWVSGQLARAWGNDRFPPPAPFEEVCLGAEQHDVGMATWDLAPERHPATGLPRQYFEVPRPTHVRLWDEAPAKMLTQSAYAALLVSLHGTGLYERFPPGEDDPEVVATVDAFLARQRALQERLVAELGLDWDDVRRNQALLAAWDGLSLALCHGRVPGEVARVPSADGDVTIALDDHGEEIAVRPWPFSRGGVRLLAEGRRLEGRFDDDAALHAALDAASRVRLRFALVPG
jgi:hypothetical protein